MYTLKPLSRKFYPLRSRVRTGKKPKHKNRQTKILLFKITVLVTLLSLLLPPIVFSSMNISFQIKNSGSIVYSSGARSGSGIGYGVGDDYLLWGGGSWSSVIPKLKSYGFTTVRLAFGFSSGAHSVFDFTKMDQAINQLRDNGINVVLDNHNWDQYNPIVGSEEMLAPWREITNHYKGQSGIVFELYNEPWNYDNNHQTLESKFQLWSYIIDQIRAIDPSRTIVFPPLDGFMWNDYSLDQTVALPSYIVNKGNLIQTFHWWYYPYEPASWDVGVNYANGKIGQLQKFLSHGYNIPVWVGETGVEPLAKDAGIAFEATVLSYCRDNNVPFSLWMYPTAPAEFDDVLNRINWTG